MKIINLGATDSLLQPYLAQIRDKSVQKDSMRFRKNLERIGEIFAYEISKTLGYQTVDVETPLGIATTRQLSEPLVLATIMRAGLPLHQGLLDVFDGAENAFVSAFRKYDRGNEFHINVDYCTCPNIEGKTLILSDTMLATGSSLEVSFNRLRHDGGDPVYTHFVCPIASVYALEYLQKHLPANTTLWTAAIDEELTSHSYIVPGLGDAGDLAYGAKL